MSTQHLTDTADEARIGRSVATSTGQIAIWLRDLADRITDAGDLPVPITWLHIQMQIMNGGGGVAERLGAAHLLAGIFDRMLVYPPNQGVEPGYAVTRGAVSIATQCTAEEFAANDVDELAGIESMLWHLAGRNNWACGAWPGPGPISRPGWEPSTWRLCDVTCPACLVLIAGAGEELPHRTPGASLAEVEAAGIAAGLCEAERRALAWMIPDRISRLSRYAEVVDALADRQLIRPAVMAGWWRLTPAGVIVERACRELEALSRLPLSFAGGVS